MLRRSYLRALIAVVIQALVNLPSPASAALFGTICDRTIYGIPDYRACQALLFGTAASRSGGIFNIDSFEHGFLLPFFGHRSQFTDWQWRHRVTLPLVWRTQGCNAALLVNINPDGGFFTDNGCWLDIARRGRYVVDTCLVHYPTGGGAGYAGALGNLTITIFASDSYFDRVITSGIEGCEILAFNVSRSRANGSGEMALVNLSGETRGYGCQISNLSLTYG